jgi:hypothetical protein
VATAERENGIPPQLLGAISQVESGRRDPLTGEMRPWPWAVNAAGQGYFYDTKIEAIAAVLAMQARGIQSIDVGCGQINLVHHPNAFPNLDVAFDPLANATYAARFLKLLFIRTGDWNRAAAAYHSATPKLGAEYQQKVLAVWPQEQPLVGVTPRTPLAEAWNATLSAPVPGFARLVRTRSEGMAQGPWMIALPTQRSVTSPGRGLGSYHAGMIGLAYQSPPRHPGG